MVELLALLKDILMPFILSYAFITITGYTFMEGVIDEFYKRIDEIGYEYTSEYEKYSGKLAKFISILKSIINPVNSLRIILNVSVENVDLPGLMIEQAMSDGMIVLKNDANNNEKEEVYKETIKQEGAVKTMSNKEKIEYLENEKNFLLDGQKNNDDIIDKCVYTKKF